MNEPTRFPPPGAKRKQCGRGPAGVRDLASGGWLNGSEQTAGAGEQTEQPHQKTKGADRRGQAAATEPQDSNRCRTAKKHK